MKLKKRIYNIGFTALSRAILSFLIAGSSITAVQGQVDKDLAYYKTAYPTDNIICTRKSEDLKIKMLGDSLALTVTTVKNNLVLNDKGAAHNTTYVYESYFTASNIDEAYSLVPNGKKKKKIKVDDIRSSTTVNEGIFFDDEITKSVFFPGLVTDAETFIRYTETYKEPRIFGSLFFCEGIPIEESTISVEFPKEVEIDYKLLNGDSLKVDLQVSETSKTKKYTWVARHVKAIDRESGSPALRCITPHILLRIKSYTTKNGRHIDVLNTTKDLYKWYSGFLSHLDKDINEHIKNAADSVTAGSKTETDKIQSIFRFCQANIKYLAIEDKLEGYIPRPAANILKNKYGDCKDIANLLCTMLRAAGMDAHLAWVGTRSLPYSCSAFPTGLCFNHMIVYLTTKEKKEYFLDATGKHHQWSVPTDMIQGQEAMVAIDSANFITRKVEVVPMEKNVNTDTFTITIDTAVIKGMGRSSFSGYYKSNLGSGDYYTGEGKVNEFVKERIAPGNNKIYISESSLTDIEPVNNVCHVSFNFRLPSYCQRVNKELFINMNLTRPLVNYYDINLERHTPVELDFKYIKKSTIILDLPQGAIVTYLPKDASWKKEKFGFELKYRKEKKQLILERTFYVNTLDIEIADFPDFMKMASELSRSFSESVSLNL